MSVRIVQWPEEFAADIKDAQREEVNRMKKIAILGSTGSIGTQTLETVRKSLQLQVVGLAAGSNVEKMEIGRAHV